MKMNRLVLHLFSLAILWFPSLLYAQCVVNVGSAGSPQICQGDSLLLEASSGFVHYEWSNGDTTRLIWVNDDGWYIVEAENSDGCIARDSILLIVFPLPSIDIVTNPPGAEICQGESISLTALGGPFIHYWWSNGDTTATAVVDPEINRVYVVEAVDANGCDARDEILVEVVDCSATDPCQVEIGIDGDTHVCGEGPIVLEPTNGFDSYNWSTGDSVRIIWVDQSGLYTLEAVDDTGCVARDSIEITFFPKTPLSITPTPNPPEICHGDTINLSASGGFLVYGWNTGDTSANISLVPEESFLVVVEALDSNECGSRATLEITVDQECTTAIDDFPPPPTFRFYPNPVEKDFVLIWEGKPLLIAEISLIDMQGKMLMQRTFTNLDNDVPSHWDISSLSPGTYILRVMSDKSYFQKLIKK